MSENRGEVARGWEERPISWKKGSRIVHYILRDSNWNTLLAVVGRERSANHIIYTPTQDYLRAFGSTDNVHIGTRWKSRKDVVKFLKSIASERGSIFDDSNKQRIESAQQLKHLVFQMTRFSFRSSHVVEEIQNPKIVWVGDAWTCSKELKHYLAFCRNETKIPVNSSVWILGGEGKDYLGYIEDMYESLLGEKMVRVRRFLFHDDIKHLIPNKCTEPREVFITSTLEQLSAKDIDGLASVLAPCDFEKCDELLPVSLSFKNFMCSREFKANKLGPFSLNTLSGYDSQHILSILRADGGSDDIAMNDPNPTHRLLTIEEGPHQNQILHNLDENIEPLSRRGGSDDLGEGSTNPTHRVLQIEEGRKGPSQNHIFPTVDENIELLSQDSGMRGRWLRCKILKSSKKLLKVQYYDVADVAGTGKLEEWVAAKREADADRLGARQPGRLTVRPCPNRSPLDATFEVGTAVDAWWCNGWWEGVVIGFGSLARNDLQVFFPGENKLMTVERENVRVSRDWVDKEWIDISPKRDILSILTSWLNPTPLLPIVTYADPQRVPDSSPVAAAE